MRIGIDCRTILNPQAGEKTGIAHYTYYLVKSLLKLNRLDEFVLFFDHRAKNIVKEFLEPNTTIRFFTYSEYKKYLPFFYSHILTASNIDREKLDVYHSPANIVPLRYSGKFCVTIHDLAIYQRPDLFPSRQGFSIKYIVPRSIKSAQKIIAVSESTKNDVEKYFNIAPEKIKVIHEGVDYVKFNPDIASAETLSGVRQKYGIDRDYVLFVGTLEPRKNLIRLLEAYYKLLGNRPEYNKKYQLVLAGGKGWLYDEIFEEVENRGLKNSVVFTDYLPAEDLPALYSNAKVFIYPSIYEGFGLPVLEAMSCGVPVITSNVSSMPEIAGNAAVLVDPLDIDGIASSLEKLLDNEEMRKEYGLAGRRRAENFSWEKCAQETMKLYKEITNLQ